MIPLIVVLFFSTSVLADLYNSSDPLVLLKSENFYQELIGAKNGWIIEFYNSWCGHCMHFAPIWREFSREVKDWSHTFKVGVIDCSDGENIPICRDYEVMAYPSIRIFGPLIKKGDTGTSVEERSIEGLQKSIVDFIIEKQTHGHGSDTWVNLLPYNGTIENIFKDAPAKAQHAVLIVENAKAPSSGSYTILDLGKYPMVYIRRRRKGGTNEIARLEFSTHPNVIVVSRDGKRQIFNDKISSREEMTALIMKYLKLNQKSRVMNILKPAPKPYGHLSSGRSADPNLSPLYKDEREGAGDGQPDEISSDRLSYDDELPDSVYHPNKNQVYMVDVENAISYILKSEVALHQIINGEHLSALKEFLDSLVDFLPARPQVRQFLLELRNYVAKAEEKLTADELEKALHFLTSPSSVLPDQQPWIGCRGSKPNYRGYPCGLWTLFHTLTVNALLTSEKVAAYDPHRSLRAIHGYVKYFFSCRECSRHFQEMFALDAESTVQVPNDEVLWLWGAHNKANKRLKGDVSEDPMHPKIQFPSKVSCPACWTEENLPSQNKILLYLKKIYGKGSLSLQGTQDLTRKDEPRDNGQGKLIHSLGRKSIEGTVADVDQRISSKMNSWSLNSLDVNLCILLYLSSTVIIAGGYLMFLLKRRLRRKKYLDFYKLP